MLRRKKGITQKYTDRINLLLGFFEDNPDVPVTFSHLLPLFEDNSNVVKAALKMALDNGFIIRLTDFQIHLKFPKETLTKFKGARLKGNTAVYEITELGLNPHRIEIATDNAENMVKLKEVAPGVLRVLGVGESRQIKDVPQTLNIRNIPNSVFSLGKMK
jgi:hypothetical protein